MTDGVARRGRKRYLVEHRITEAERLASAAQSRLDGAGHGHILVQVEGSHATLIDLEGREPAIIGRVRAADLDVWVSGVLYGATL